MSVRVKVRGLDFPALIFGSATVFWGGGGGYLTP